jgi:beta-lactamase superfamily II metal-dependent hydrolase
MESHISSFFCVENEGYFIVRKILQRKLVLGSENIAQLKYIDEDLLKVYKSGKKRNQENLLTTLFWGDNVKVVEQVGDYWKLDFTRREWNKATKKYEWVKYDAAIPKETRFRENPILKIRFVDVGQGDAAIIESPQRKLVLIDGGEGDDLSHYVSAAWAHIFRHEPLGTEAVVITHGDADHFAGLTKLCNKMRRKDQPLITVKRVYHNGLVKAPESVKDIETFGKTETKQNKLYITDLVDDPSTIDDARLNKYFKEWKKTLKTLKTYNPNLEIRRIANGDNQSFSFLENEKIHIQILGPITEDVKGKPALRYFQGKEGGLLPAQTINGHSIILRLTYGNVRVLFGADLNAESETGLLEYCRKTGTSLASEILKVPHHGSADFNPGMFQAVSPAVSVISSGDENVSKEYIHPRAGLVGALGKYANPTVERPLIYVTEMVAFFERVGRATVQRLDAKEAEDKKAFETANAYIKKIYGIVHVRTDGERVLVVTHGGNPDNKESYAFKVDQTGKITFEEKVRAL